MWSRIRRAMHPLLTLALVVCCAYLLWRDSCRLAAVPAGPVPPSLERLSAHEDAPLRNFLNVRWLGGDYELPADEEHCVAVLLKFEDGKFKGRQHGTAFSPVPGGSRVVPFYAMWGPGPNGPRAASGWQGVWTASDNDPFYAGLNGDLARFYGKHMVYSVVRGYRVIGYAASKQMRAGREQFEHTVGGSWEEFINNHQRVLILGVKPFATHEEAWDWFENHAERAEP